MDMAERPFGTLICLCLLGMLHGFSAEETCRWNCQETQNDSQCIISHDVGVDKECFVNESFDNAVLSCFETCHHRLYNSRHENECEARCPGYLRTFCELKLTEISPVRATNVEPDLMEPPLGYLSPNITMNLSCPASSGMGTVVLVIILLLVIIIFLLACIVYKVAMPGYVISVSRCSQPEIFSPTTKGIQETGYERLPD